MSRITIANLKKTIYYFQRNGLRDTCHAALERFQIKQEKDYTYRSPSEEELRLQGKKSWERPVKFSILVPAYRTPAPILKAMIQSVLDQTYSNLELLIGDATEDDCVKTVVESYKDHRILYVPLKKNEGISGNTNVILEMATGDYIGLLDHDDLLTPDALYEMACKIQEYFLKNQRVEILYSDEDKCDETGTLFYEPHYKKEFNLDLLLSNNYICHFLVMKKEFLKDLGFRKEYDGAQDYDLVLRGAARLLKQGGNSPEASVVHIKKVLYHWRCHRDSTAANPQSKMYAYEAGKRALEDFLRQMDWAAKVTPLPHLGFYRVDYEEKLWEVRSDIGVIGGKLLGKDNKIKGGIYDETGSCPYFGLKAGYSGYMHLASLHQNAFAVDVRLMEIRPELKPFFVEITGQDHESFEASRLPEGMDLEEVNQKFCEKIRQEGYRILWDPKWSKKIRDESRSGVKIENNNRYSKL